MSVREPPPLVLATALAVVATLSLACGASPPVPSATPTPPSAGAVQSPAQFPNATMFQIFSGVDHPVEDSIRALQLVRETKDTSQVRVIVEIMQAWGPSLRVEAVKTLTTLTGQDFGTDFDAWEDWMEWLGRQPGEYPPPEEYLKWKIILFSLIDPRYVEFLAPAEKTARIDLTELAWGGVRPDGIPDLLNAPVIPAAEARYLGSEDRVFGVSINGEHRAYPLRILNAHEMANDVLGGEPIALAY